MDTERIQGTRDSHPCETGKKPEGMEGEVCEGLQSGVPHCRMQTEAGLPDCLKAVAERGKLDPNGFRPHKFRATFATRCLWAGVDLRTVQQWLGHSDMESTMRYLKPSRSQHVRDKVNEIFA